MKFITLILTLLILPLHAAWPVRAISEVIDQACQVSGRTLTPVDRSAATHQLHRLWRQHGDVVLQTARHGGLETLAVSPQYGKTFWQLGAKLSPLSMRQATLHAAEFMPLLQKLGSNFLKLEQRVPGLAAAVVQTFGEPAVNVLKSVPRADVVRLLGYARRADTPETVQLLYRTYRQRGSRWLNHLNWKNIMATGLTCGIITASYQLSDGVSQTLQQHPAIVERFLNQLAQPLIWFEILLLLGILLLLAWCGVKIHRIVKSRRQKNAEK